MMQRRRNTRANTRRAVLALGLIGATIIVLGSFITALGFQGRQGEAYSPLNHFISELGEIGVSRRAMVFNRCLFIGGLCLTIFMLGLAAHLGGWFSYVFGLVGVVAGISGALVGVFPMNMRRWHSLVAVTFFNAGMVAAGLFRYMSCSPGKTSSASGLLFRGS